MATPLLRRERFPVDHLALVALATELVEAPDDLVGLVPSLCGVVSIPALVSGLQKVPSGARFVFPLKATGCG